MAVTKKIKQRRTRLSKAQKIEAATLLNRGYHAEAIMRQFNVSRRTVTNIRHNADSLRQSALSSSASLARKSNRPAVYEDIEEKLISFVSFARASKLPVTASVLQEKALLIRDQLHDSSEKEEEKARLSRFRASKGWACKFVTRHALRSVSLSGETGSVDAAKVAGDISQLREKLKDYHLNCIFNVDETGLFFRLLPKRTYITQYENRKSVRGTKAMKAKDRVTAYVCTNADGSLKLPMAIIGKSANPRCFRIRSPPVPYLSQKNAWSDTVTFRKWFFEVFLPAVRKFTSKPCVLLMDNCGPHGTDISDCRDQVVIMTLPPNCTALHQPMDMGIISAWKRGYRSALLREILSDVENREAKREENRTLKAGMKGIKEGYNAHMLDVAEMVHQSWDEVSKITISRCWRKANILPAVYNADINAVDGRMKKDRKDQNVSVIINMLEKLSLNVSEQDPFFYQLCDSIDEQDISRWLDIENDRDVQDAIVEDEMEDLFSTQATVPNESDSEVDCEQITNEASCRLPLPSETELMALFAPLESVCANIIDLDAQHFIRMAKSTLLKAKRTESKGRSRQLLITEMFKA